MRRLRRENWNMAEECSSKSEGRNPRRRNLPGRFLHCSERLQRDLLFSGPVKNIGNILLQSAKYESMMCIIGSCEIGSLIVCVAEVQQLAEGGEVTRGTSTDFADVRRLFGTSAVSSA